MEGKDTNQEVCNVTIASAESLPIEDNAIPSRWQHIRTQMCCCFSGNLGQCLIMISTIMLAFSKFFVKIAAKNVNSLQIVFLRFSLQVIITLPCAIKNRASLYEMHGKELVKFLSAAFCKAMAQTATFYGVSLILVEEAVVLLNLQPIMVCLIAWKFLGEDIGFFDFIMSVLTIIGVVVTCNPHFNSFNDISRIRGILVMVAAAALNSVGNCLTRFLGSVHFSTLICMQACIGLPVIAIFFFASSDFVVPSKYVTLIFVLALCVLAIGGRCLETKAFQIAHATPLTILKTFEIAICFMLQYFVLGVKLTAMSVSGTCLVSACVILICIKKKALEFIHRLRRLPQITQSEDICNPLAQKAAAKQNLQYGSINK